MNSALHAARDRATRASDAQTTRSLRTRLLCRIRCMLVQTALLLTAADHLKPPRRASAPFQESVESFQTRLCPNVHSGVRRRPRFSFLVEVRFQTRGFRALKHPLLSAQEPSSSVCAARLQTPGKCATCARTSTVASFSL